MYNSRACGTLSNIDSNTLATEHNFFHSFNFPIFSAVCLVVVKGNSERKVKKMLWFLVFLLPQNTYYCKIPGYNRNITRYNQDLLN